MALKKLETDDDISYSSYSAVLCPLKFNLGELRLLCVYVCVICKGLREGAGGKFSALSEPDIPQDKATRETHRLQA